MGGRAPGHYHVRRPSHVCGCHSSTAFEQCVGRTLHKLQCCQSVGRDSQVICARVGKSMTCARCGRQDCLGCLIGLPCVCLCVALQNMGSLLVSGNGHPCCIVQCRIRWAVLPKPPGMDHTKAVMSLGTCAVCHACRWAVGLQTYDASLVVRCNSNYAGRWVVPERVLHIAYCAQPCTWDPCVCCI